METDRAQRFGEMSAEMSGDLSAGNCSIAPTWAGLDDQYGGQLLHVGCSPGRVSELAVSRVLILAGAPDMDVRLSAAIAAALARAGVTVLSPALQVQAMAGAVNMAGFPPAVLDATFRRWSGPVARLCEGVVVPMGFHGGGPDCPVIAAAAAALAVQRPVYVLAQQFVADLWLDVIEAEYPEGAGNWD